MKMSFLGGALLGAIVGSAITMVADPVSDRQRKKLYRGTHHVFKTMGAVIDNMMMNK